MRTLAILLITGATLAQAQTPPAVRPTAPASKAPMRHVGTMSELMVKILYPSSDALFYIETRTPTTDSEWTVLEGQAGRARDQRQWMDDSKLLLDAGAAALTAAKAKDVPAIVALSDQLYESCTSCHTHDRPGYGKKHEGPST